MRSRPSMSMAAASWTSRSSDHVNFLRLTVSLFFDFADLILTCSPLFSRQPTIPVCFADLVFQYCSLAILYQSRHHCYKGKSFRCCFY